jgi:hypothetical protein
VDADEIAARVRALVDAAPPLNAGQQAVIRAMLAPASTPPQVRGGEKARRESFEQIVRRPAA